MPKKKVLKKSKSKELIYKINKDWIDKDTQDVAMLASQSKKIYVIGCSMGAVLAFYIASVFP